MFHTGPQTSRWVVFHTDIGEVESLQSRRGFAAAALALKLLDGKAHVELQPFTPRFAKPTSLTKKRTRESTSVGLQLENTIKSNSLDIFRRSYLGCIRQIWRKLPQSLIEEGNQTYWLMIKKRVKGFLEGKWTLESHQPKKPKLKRKVEQAYSTKLNQELNAQDTDWMELHLQLKHSGISLKH